MKIGGRVSSLATLALFCVLGPTTVLAQGDTAGTASILGTVSRRGEDGCHR